MTGRAAGAIRAPMLRHAWFLLLCLLASSLVATATVHAQESFAAVDISCGGTMHAEGDGDEVPADSDQRMPHHHGACHGHSLTAPVMSSALTAMAVACEIPNPSGTPRFANRTIGPALEPPRA